MEAVPREFYHNSSCGRCVNSIQIQIPDEDIDPNSIEDVEVNHLTSSDQQIPQGEYLDLSFIILLVSDAAIIMTVIFIIAHSFGKMNY